MVPAHDVLWWLWNGITGIPLVWTIGAVLAVLGLIVGGYDWLSRERQWRRETDRRRAAYQGSLDGAPEPPEDPPVAHGS